MNRMILFSIFACFLINAFSPNAFAITPGNESDADDESDGGAAAKAVAAAAGNESDADDESDGGAAAKAVAAAAGNESDADDESDGGNASGDDSFFYVDRASVVQTGFPVQPGHNNGAALAGLSINPFGQGGGGSEARGLLLDALTGAPPFSIDKNGETVRVTIRHKGFLEQAIIALSENQDCMLCTSLELWMPNLGLESADVAGIVDAVKPLKSRFKHFNLNFTGNNLDEFSRGSLRSLVGQDCSIGWKIQF
jgi:hypothetical protein